MVLEHLPINGLALEGHRIGDLLRHASQVGGPPRGNRRVGCAPSVHGRANVLALRLAHDREYAGIRRPCASV